MKRYPRLLKFLRRTLLPLAVLATLLALGIVVENWRGDRAWAAVERDLRARGEPLDLAAFQTPRVPDERNFFKAPTLENLLYAAPNDPQNKKLLADAKLSPLATSFVVGIVITGKRSGPPSSDAKSGILVRTPDSAEYLHQVQKRLHEHKLLTAPPSDDPATEILAALKPAQFLLDAVVQAARDRPAAWLVSAMGELVSSNKPKLDTQTAISLVRVLAGRAKVEIALGQMDAAFADIKAILKFSIAVSSAVPPTLQNAIGAEAMRAAAVDVLKDGCDRQQWTEPQLAELQVLFLTYPALANLRQALQMERIAVTWILDSPPPFDPFVPYNRAVANSALVGVNLKPWPWWLIRGWAQQNKATFAKQIDIKLASLDPAAGRIFPEKLEDLEKYAVSLEGSWSPYNWLVKSTANLIGPIPIRPHPIAQAIASMGASENALHEAAVACALERFRLAHGRYPDTLSELTPALITAVPIDVFTGQPLGYTRAAEDGLILTATDAGGKAKGKTWTQSGPR